MNKYLAIFVTLAFSLLSCALKPSQEQPPSLTASFSYVPASPVAGQPVQYTDTSTGNPTSWEWAFGDGQTSVLQNPSHTYIAAGSYTVTLTVVAGTNSNSTSRTITVLPETEGAVYYVDTAHSSASDSNPGTENLPWKTITKANQTLVAGDTVYIKAGIYSSYVAPANSGTPSNRLTYRSYGFDVVTIRDTSAAITLNAKSYITVQGINFYNCDIFMHLTNSANHNVIAYCNFDQVRNRNAWPGSRIAGSSKYNWIHHCRFSKYGEIIDGDDRACVLDIGNEESKTDLTSHNLIEYNNMFHGGHHVLGVYGTYNVIRNNYFHNENWINGHGNRNVKLSGYPENSGHNLIEGNQIAYSGDPPDNWGAGGMGLDTGYNIVRLNRFYYNNLSGLAMTLTSTYYSDIIYNKIYNNSFLHNGFNMSTGPDALTSAIGFAIYSGTHIIKYNSIKNNIYYDHYHAVGTYRVNLTDQILANNWEGDTQGNPKFINASLSLGDPMNLDLPDLRLQADSPCIDQGSFLTRIISANGVGTQFQVEDASYFCDGWGIEGVQGDMIQIVGTSRKTRITNVDYSTNTITVDATLTWTQNQGIALAYVGAAPDVGAHEYGSQPSPVKK